MLLLLFDLAWNSTIANEEQLFISFSPTLDVLGVILLLGLLVVVGVVVVVDDAAGGDVVTPAIL
jgi:hypothetical protein